MHYTIQVAACDLSRAHNEISRDVTYRAAGQASARKLPTMTKRAITCVIIVLICLVCVDTAPQQQGEALCAAVLDMFDEFGL